jgi:SAM-dependent methyltransferase/uncharacterized protein YbaR (Trm112 family)
MTAATTRPGHQPPEFLEQLLPLLRDPVDKERLTIERDDHGRPAGVLSSRHAYQITDGIPRMLVDEDTLVDAFGVRNVDAFLRLQQAAEASYAVRSEGHFSTPSFGPAVDYGSLLARFERGLYLDVGCGLLPEPVYMQRARQLTFVGIDPIQLSAERRFPFAQAYGDFLPFGGSCFDGVLFSSALDHVFNPQQALEEALRVLKPGGKLVILTAIRREDAAFRCWQRRAVFFATLYNARHHWAFSADSLADLMADAGARIQAVEATRNPRVVVVVSEKPFLSGGQHGIHSRAASPLRSGDQVAAPDQF